jgi:hypothetical protein
VVRTRAHGSAEVGAAVAELLAWDACEDTQELRRARSCRERSGDAREAEDDMHSCGHGRGNSQGRTRPQGRAELAGTDGAAGAKQRSASAGSPGEGRRDGARRGALQHRHGRAVPDAAPNCLPHDSRASATQAQTQLGSCGGQGDVEPAAPETLGDAGERRWQRGEATSQPPIAVGEEEEAEPSTTGGGRRAHGGASDAEALGFTEDDGDAATASAQLTVMTTKMRSAKPSNEQNLETRPDALVGVDEESPVRI